MKKTMSNTSVLEREVDELLNLLLTNNSKTKQTKVEKELDKISSTLVKEAIKHFNKTKHFRPENEEDFDERYLYSSSEVEEFVKLNKNPKVKIKKLNDSNGFFFCYKLYRWNNVSL